MSKPGPLPFLDEIKRREICAMLTVGASQRAAADYVGCSPGTITNTAKREPDFARQIERATAECEFNSLQKINAAGDRSWRAAAWILERTRPERYEKVTLRQPTCEQIAGFWDDCSAALLDDLPDEQRFAMARKLRELSDRFVEFVRTPGGTRDDDDFHPLEDLCGDEDGVLRFVVTGLGLTNKEIPRLRAALPGSASPFAPAGERRKRHEALERLREQSVQQWQARCASMTPDELAAEERRIARRTEREQNADLAYFREHRAGIAAARQAGDDISDWDWIAQLKDAQVPPEHPAYAEFAMGLEEWVAWRGRQGEEVQRSVDEESARVGEGESGGMERGEECEKCEEGEGGSETKDFYAAQAGKVGALQPRGAAYAAVAVLALFIPLLAALIGGLASRGPVFQDRPNAAAIFQAQIAQECSPSEPAGVHCSATLTPAGFGKPAHAELAVEAAAILEQNPPHVPGQAFKDRR